MMLDGRSSLGFPRGDRGPAAAAPACQEWPGSATEAGVLAGFSSKLMLCSCDGMARPVAIAALVNNSDMVCEIAHVG
jgi:hypothetical protein